MTPSPRPVGVLIGRFQIHSLTEGHKYLFAQVAGRCSRVLALVGVPPVLGTRRDPLEYPLRARMLQDWWAEAFRDGPELMVLPSFDHQDDAAWATRIDQMVNAVAIGQPVIVFGGPDGCCDAYRKAGGGYPTEAIESIPGHKHATVYRQSLQARHTEDFRAGVIYHSQRQFLNPFPVIDVAVLRHRLDPAKAEVLLAQKPGETHYWRLIGGFVDVDDLSFERAAKREVAEETGVEIGGLTYVGSAPVEDWRYRGTPERIFSAVFVADHVFGAPAATDDIAACAWHSCADVAGLLHPQHKPLWALVQDYLFNARMNALGDTTAVEAMAT